MHALRRYWERLFSRQKSARDAGQGSIAPDMLEREISVVSNESHALAEEVKRVRSEFEHARDEESRKIVDLEQVRHAMQEDQRKLAELESINDHYAAARESDRRRISELEARLAEIEGERRQARERVQALENNLTKATTRLEQADRQIKDIQVNVVEQAKQFQASIADASQRLVETDNQVKVLNTRLDDEHRQVLKTFQALQDRFRRQDVRLNWTITAAGFGVLLGIVVGAVLIWDVQKHSALLTGMSRDIKDLMASVNSRSGMSPVPQAATQPPALPAIAPGSTASPPVKPGPAQPAAKPAPEATIETKDVNPNLLSDALDRNRRTNREGVRQPTRAEAESFFERNASVPGVVTLSSGVQYRVTNAGNGKSPAPEDKVVLSYVGTKLDGTVIDESYTGGVPAAFSMNELLPAWREVLLKMKEGAEFEMYLPPDQVTRGNVRKRGVTGFEPTIYLIELKQVIKNAASGTATPGG